MADTKQIEAMKRLGFSDEEIAEVLADDKAIDQGKRMPFDLTPEEEKKAKKYANADEHKKPAEKAKRERKPNEYKGNFIAELREFIAENFTDSPNSIIILNAEREISWENAGTKYKITLSCPRK